MGGGIRKLENSLTQYAARALGANNVTRELSVAMGAMAIGGGPLTAVVLAVGAVVTVYEKLTKASHDAEASVKRLSDAMKIQAAGPGGQTAIDVNAVRAENIRLRGERQRLRENLGGPGVLQELDLRRISDLTAKIAENQKLIGYGQGVVNKAIADAEPKLTTVHTKTKAIKDATADLAKEWQKVVDAMVDAYNNPFTAQGSRAMNQAANDVLNAGLAKDLNAPVDISDSVRIASDQAKAINETARSEQQKTRDVISNSALQGAQIIVSALNIGGGGKGSGLGGALGSTAGFAIGYMTGGPVGGAIGATVGNIAGSLIGGLFDHHKKAVDSNTRALNQLTNTLLNGPSGYRLDYARYGATNPADLYDRTMEEAQRRAARGGATIWQIIHGGASV